MQKLFTSLLLIMAFSWSTLAVTSPQKLRRASPSGGSSDLSTGLVSYWGMEEAGVTDRQDAVGANSLIASAAITNDTGKIGNAAKFDGTAYLLKADNSTLDFTTAFTWAGWIYQDSLLINQSIALKWVDAQASWAIATSTGGTDVYVLIADSLADAGSNYGATTDAGFSATTFYHVAVVYDGSLTGNANRLKIYINGAQKTLSFTGTIAASVPNSTVDLYYGAWPGLSRPLAGRIDEVGLWNIALTGAQVGRLYNVNAGCSHPFSACP